MSYPIIAGLPVIVSADIADITSDANAKYPSGIGKRDGMFALEDNGTTKDLVMANGSATDDTWTIVGDGAASIVVTPA
jgi:hypothetical protein